MMRALDAVAEYVSGLNAEVFTTRRVIIDAVAMNLIVVGESASKLSDVLKSQVAAPWAQVVALRHRLAHEYFGMNIDRLWVIASERAPELRRQVAAWLERC